jgi:hypothetical protein
MYELKNVLDFNKKYIPSSSSILISPLSPPFWKYPDIKALNDVFVH